MDDRLKESISALMDDEANELELQRVLSNTDEDVSGTWQRYHQIRQVMREGDPEVLAIDIRASLASELDYDAEDTFDAEGAFDVEGGATLDSVGNQAAVTEGGNVAELPAKTSRLRSAFAIAASGVLALVLATQYQQGLNSNSSQPLVAEVTPEQSVQDQGIQKVALTEASSESPRSPKIIVEFSDEHMKRFNEYLLRHAEHSSFGAGQGVMPLARVASLNSVGI